MYDNEESVCGIFYNCTPYYFQKNLQEMCIRDRYKSVVEGANTMRMLYASYHMKQRDSLLPVIQRKLLAVSSAEREILTALLGLAGKELAK